MQTKNINHIEHLLRNNTYPGRGIIIGKSENNNICIAYFLSGRSQNSRNRILEEVNGDVFTKAFDESKVEDPSLIIYPAIKTLGNTIIVTNGDHTDTIYDGLKNNISFEDSLFTRKFEPDSPNFTPRISGIVSINETDFTYKLSILKSGTPQGTTCDRFFYNYESVDSIGHFIHTYTDANPLISFIGEPIKIHIPNDIDEFSKSIWENLDNDNKISLYVRYIDLKNNTITNKIINKNL